MAYLTLGNVSVVESYKEDEGTNVTKLRARKDLGKQITTMSLNETDIDDRPSRAMNLTMAIRFWEQHSDKPPAWVESDDRLLAELIADHFGCDIGRPKKWSVG